MGDMGQVRLPKDLIKRLKEHKRPHQAIAGVIEDLLNYIDNKESKTDEHNRDKSI